MKQKRFIISDQEPVLSDEFELITDDSDEKRKYRSLCDRIFNSKIFERSKRKQCLVILGCSIAGSLGYLGASSLIHKTESALSPFVINYQSLAITYNEEDGSLNLMKCEHEMSGDNIPNICDHFESIKQYAPIFLNKDDLTPDEATYFIGKTMVQSIGVFGSVLKFDKFEEIQHSDTNDRTMLFRFSIKNQVKFRRFLELRQEFFSYTNIAKAAIGYETGVNFEEEFKSAECGDVPNDAKHYDVKFLETADWIMTQQKKNGKRRMLSVCVLIPAAWVLCLIVCSCARGWCGRNPCSLSDLFRGGLW